MRSKATTLAAILDLFITALFFLLAVAAVIGVSVTRNFPSIEGGPSARTVFYVAALVIIGVCIWTGTIGLKLLQLRSWARVAGIVTFGGFVLLSLTSFFAPRGPGGASGLLLTSFVTACDAAIVVALLTPSAARDFAGAQPPDSIEL